MDRPSWRVLIAVLLLLGGTAGFLRHARATQRLGTPGVKVVAEPVLGEDGKIIATNAAWLPPRVLDYESEPVRVAKVVSDWLPKDTTFGHRLYRAPDGFLVDYQIVLMGADRTSLHQPQYCLTGTGWQINSESEASIAIGQARRVELPVKKLLLTLTAKDEQGATVTRRGVFVYWFVADGELTASHRERMWWMARDLLQTGVLQRWAYVICFSTCSPGQEDAAFGRMKQFIAASVPEYQVAWPGK